MSSRIDELYEILREQVGVSEDTIRIVTKINGFTEETLLDILEVETGCKTLDEYIA